MVACGLCVSLEFGRAIPRSGGEKNYLERVYQKPKYLITCVIAALFLLFGAGAPAALAFASYVLHAAGRENPTSSWEARIIAVSCIAFVTLVHSFLPSVQGPWVLQDRHPGIHRLLRVRRPRREEVSPRPAQPRQHLHRRGRRWVWYWWRI
jgi:hypothetical protein